MERHFEEMYHAKIYDRYRPHTQQSVVDFIVDYVREKNGEDLNLMIDVGCGTGQNTLVFAPYFKKVIGTDISSNMITQASSVNSSSFLNVSFVVSPAENLVSVADESADLVAAAQSFHWFNQENFHKEMSRVLKFNGVLALLGHDPEFLVDLKSEENSEKLLNVATEFSSAVFPYLKKAAAPLFDRYSNVDFPYVDVVRKNIRCDVPITLADYVGVLKTYSCFQSLSRELPQEAERAQTRVIKSILEIFDLPEETAPEDVKTTMRLENFILMGRKDVNNKPK
ncbi:hypothetical protein CHUAL_007950 [Chamberlinius hualienensis]